MNRQTSPTVHALASAVVLSMGCATRGVVVVEPEEPSRHHRGPGATVVVEPEEPPPQPPTEVLVPAEPTPGPAIDIPPGHMPPPGECRIWYPGVPPGQQPPPGDCRELERHVPAGAFLVRG